MRSTIVSAVVMVVLAVVLRVDTADAQAAHEACSTAQLLASMGHLALHTPVLQRRALYQACLFGAFSLFWTTTPLLLASPAFGLTQNGIALFALAGAAGAIASPIAGRLADRGMTRSATAFAMLLAIAAFLIGPSLRRRLDAALALLTFAGILLDFGVQTNVVLGQRAIYEISARAPQPLERALHGNVLRRRRHRLCGRRLGLCDRRLEPHLLDRPLLPAAGTCHLHDREALPPIRLGDQSERIHVTASSKRTRAARTATWLASAQFRSCARARKATIQDRSSGIRRSAAWSETPRARHSRRAAGRAAFASACAAKCPGPSA